MMRHPALAGIRPSKDHLAARVRYGAFLTLTIVGIISCQRRDRKSSQPCDVSTMRTSSPSTAFAGVLPDSSCAVQLAIYALQGELHPLRVDTFRRIDHAYQISLLPVDRGPGYVIVGGGGLVEVKRGGAIRIIERYR